MRVALVHDYLTQRGGAERVVLTMLKAFPGAPLYTSLYEPESTYPEFAAHDVRPMWMNQSRALRRDHRRGLLLYPFAFGRLKLDPEPDVVVCSSSGFAHGIQTTACKLVYCYTPPRWLYQKAPTYLAGCSMAVRAGLRAAAPALRSWDLRATKSADAYLTSSSAVAADILATYGRRAAVLPPPVHVQAVGEQRPIAGLTPGFILCVGRLMGYKNVGAVLAAIRHLPGSRLVVVGRGPVQSRLAAVAPPNVRFVAQVSDAELRWLYASCAGLVSAAYEDYGLTPIEAAGFGKPVAVLRAGGFLDTVREGETGVFFDAPTPALIAEAMGRLMSTAWDREAVVAHASRFGEARFMTQLRDAVYAAKVRHDAGCQSRAAGAVSRCASPQRGNGCGGAVDAQGLPPLMEGFPEGA